MNDNTQFSGTDLGRTERADPVDQIRDMIDEGGPDLLSRIADFLLGPEDARRASPRPVAMDELAQTLQEFVDYHTKPAGMTIDIALNKDKCREFMASIDNRHAKMVSRAQALLSKRATQPPTAAVVASDDATLITEAVKANNVYGVLSNSASTMSIGRAVLAAERARAAQQAASCQLVASNAEIHTLRRLIECAEKLDERARPMCRDCADENGTCPNSGLECDMRKLFADAKALHNKLAAPACQGAAQKVEAFAWAAFADNGNVIIWSKRRSEVEPVAAKCGRPVTPVIALQVAAPMPVQATGDVREDASTKQEKLRALADRIDHEKLWSKPRMDRLMGRLSDAECDRLDAGVALRRYADLLAPGRWLILPPTGSVQFSAGSLDKAYEMAKQDEARKADRAAMSSVTAIGGKGGA